MAGNGGWVALAGVQGLPDRAVLYVRSIPQQRRLWPRPYQEAESIVERLPNGNRVEWNFTTGMVMGMEQVRSLTRAEVASLKRQGRNLDLVWKQYVEAAMKDDWQVAEVYLDGRRGFVSPLLLGGVAWYRIENEIAELREPLARRLYDPAPDLATFASYWAFDAGAAENLAVFDPQNWVHVALASQSKTVGPDGPTFAYPSDLDYAAQAAEDSLSVVRHFEGPPNGRLTDDWYRRLAIAYEACFVNNLNPAPELARVTGTPERTVQGWFAKARKRGFLAPGIRGQAGFNTGEGEGK